MEDITVFLLWAGISLVGLLILLWFFPITLWFQALISGVRISLMQLVLMRWRKVPPGTIVIAMITGTKAGLKLDANSLEAHYLAKGNVIKVVNALISADKANIALDFKMAAAIDLAGRDVFEAVQMSVNPKVITTKNISAVAKDGIELISIARVTVRTNIRQLVGGAGEETILARVGEGIVSSVGSAKSHKDVLALIEKHNDDELFTKKKYHWTGTTSLGAYFIGCLSSHYDWAFKTIKPLKKLIKGVNYGKY